MRVFLCVCVHEYISVHSGQIHDEVEDHRVGSKDADSSLERETKRGTAYLPDVCSP